MAEEITYDQIETGDPDPLGLRRQLKQAKKPAQSVDPLGLRSQLRGTTAPQQPAFQIKIEDPAYGRPIEPKYESTWVKGDTYLSESGITAPKEFSFDKPYDPLAVEKLKGKAAEAYKKIQAELQANDDVYAKKVREFRRDSYTLENLRDDYKRMGIILSPQDEQKTLKREKEKRYYDAVTAEDVSDIKAGTILDNTNARKFIKDLNKQDLVKNAYLVDKYNEVASDPNGSHRVEKIKNVAKLIEKGDIIYDPERKIAIQPLGLIGSAVEGVKNKFKSEEEHDFFKNASDATIINELENQRNNPDTDEPLKVPKGKAQQILMTLAEMPIGPIAVGVAGTVGGTFIGNPELGVIGATALGAYENRKINYTQAFKQVYNEVRDQGGGEHDAIEKARKFANYAQEIGTIVGAAQGAIGANIAATPLRFSVPYQRSIGQMLKQVGSDLGTVLIEGSTQGGLAAFGEVAKNKTVQAFGVKRDISSGVSDAFWSNLLMTVGIGAAMKAGRGMTKENYRTILHGLSKVPEDNINPVLQEQVKSGAVTQEAADQTLGRINEYKELDKLIPENVPEGARFKIQDKILKRKQLEEQIESTDKAYHPAIKEKIKAIDEEIIGLSKDTVKPEKVESGLSKSQEKEAIETAEEFLAEGILPNTYESMIKQDPVGFWKMIAQQAQNRDENWKPLTQELPEQAVRDQFGDTVVEYAKELFPAPEAAEPSRLVSVIQPSEIKQTEVKEPPKEQQLIDIRNGDISTFEYSSESEVPEIFKDKISLIGEKNGKPFVRVSMAKSLADYYLSQTEIKKSENITIKPKENSVSERSAETPIVDEAPGSGPEVGAGIPEPGEAATPQEGQQPTQEESITPGQEGQVEEPRTTGITHRQMDVLAEELGLPTYEKSPERVVEWDQQAAKKLQEPDALDNLFTKLRKGELPDHVETRMMLQYMGDIMAKIERNPYDRALQDQLLRTKDLFNIAGRLQGKGLAARKGHIPVEETLPDFIMRDREVNKAPLTDEQITKSKEEFEAIKKAKDDYEQKVAKLEAENAKLKAEKVVKEEAKKAKKSSGKDYAEERKQILTDLKKKWDSSKGQLSSTFIPYADRLVKIAPDVVKLMKSYVEQGITELPDVVKAIHKTIKDHIDGVSEKDVHDIIAGEYNTKKPTRNQLAQQLFDLRKEAKLINELEQLEAGKIPDKPDKVRQRNQKIEALRQQIKELRDEVGLNEKTDEQKLSSLKARYKKQIAEVEKKIQDGDYGPDEKPTPLKLDKEAQDLKDELLRLKDERAIRLLKQQYADRTKGEKRVAGIGKALRTGRQIQSGFFDVSYPFRQTIVGVARQLLSLPFKRVNGKIVYEGFKSQGQLRKQFGEMYRAFGSEKGYRRTMADIKESPRFDIAQKSKLDLAEIDAPLERFKEEEAQQSYAEKIPVAKQAVRMSNRAATVIANKMKFDIFNQLVDGFEESGKTFDNSPELYKEAAIYANKLVGRGFLGEKLEMASPLIGHVLYSLRLQASRLQLLTSLLNPRFYTKVPKEIRIEYLKDMTKFVLMGSAMLGLAKAAGLGVELDPRSSDFGSIKWGDTRYDIWGGFKQYVTLFSRLLTASTKSPETGQVSSLKIPFSSGKPERNEKTYGDILLRFGRTKASPEMGTLTDILSGETFDKRPITAQGEFVSYIAPLIIGDIYDSWKDNGVLGAALTYILSTHGIGTQSHIKEDSFDDLISGEDADDSSSKSSSKGRHTKSTKKIKRI